MAVEIGNYVDIGSSTQSGSSVVYEVLGSEMFPPAVRAVGSGLTDETKEALSVYGDAGTVSSALETIAKSSLYPVIAMRYADLKELAESGGLIAGRQYMVTDYVATTTDDDSESANHPFQLILVANGDSTFCEEARAYWAEGDAYFTGCDLQAWRVWYDFTNDTTRFAWADSANGKGVIYRLIDEWGNDCPFDFKGLKVKCYDAGEGWERMCYVFDSGEGSGSTDMSLDGLASKVFGNEIGRLSYEGLTAWLPKVVFMGGGTNLNKISENCNTITFRANSSRNIVGFDCSRLVFGKACLNNVIGNTNYETVYGDNCYNNKTGNYCFSNKFGDWCHHNEFGDDCIQVAFGDNCYYISLGEWCQYVYFGDYYESIRIGSNCRVIEFEGNKSYIRNIEIGSGINNLQFDLTATTSSSEWYQNVSVAMGMSYTTVHSDEVDQTVWKTYAPAGSGIVEV